MKVYYAHCQTIYNTPQEERDIGTIFAIIKEPIEYNGLPTEVINPAETDQEEIWRRKAAGENVMETYFKPLVLSCDILAFRALPDGRIPSGVASEIEWANEAGIPVFELPSGLLKRRMDYPETVEYLKESGNR